LPPASLLAPVAKYVAGTQYHWRVLPLNATGVPLTADFEARPVTFMTVPSVPVSVKAIASGTTISVSWSKPVDNGGSPVIGYQLRWRASGAADWNEERLLATANPYSLTGLAGGAKHEFALAAITDIGTGPFSTIASATTGAVPGAPTLGAVTGGDRSAVVSWTPPTTTNGTITGYTVTAVPGDVIVRPAATARSVTVSGLTAGETYTFSVQAVNANGPGTASPSSEPVTLSAFSDVLPGAGFYADIQWMLHSGISTGTVLPSGAREYQPGAAVSRQVMSAFLYRAAGSPPFTAPAVPSFADVAVEHPFYRQIEWMKDAGISTGTTQSSGKPLFKPSDAVSRSAMAPFLYRAAGQPAFTTPAQPRFADVPTSHPFYKQIEWMAAMGISTGTTQPSGLPLYKPVDPVSRQAMAERVKAVETVGV